VQLWFWAALLILSMAATAVGCTRAYCRWRSPILPFGVLVCFLCLGAIRLISFSIAGPNDIRHVVGDDEQTLATVRGWVATDPHVGEPNWCFGRLVFEDSPSRFYMNLNAVKTGHDWTAATGTIHVRVDEPTPNLKPGDCITIECWLHRFGPPTNPGQFDIARYLARINVYVGAAVPSRDSITVDRTIRPDGWARLRSRMSQMAAQALLGDARIDDPDEGLVQALLLGSRQDIDPATYEAFRRTGLLHLVSLSGMNFAMLISMIWWVCRAVGLSKSGRALVAIAATAVFLMVVPSRAPTIRAAIIVWAYCASILAGRRVRSFNILCLAAIIVLWLGPTQVFEAGCQLSFGCMAGILAFTDRIDGFLRGLMPRRLSHENPTGHRATVFIRYVTNQTILAISMGLAAWAGGAGFLLYHFYTITPLTSLWTVLTSVLVWIIMMTGFIQILLASLLPTISVMLGGVGRAMADVFIVAVRIMAAPKINLVLIGHVGVWVVVLYYALILFWLFGLMKRTRLKQGVCVAVVIVLAGHLGVLKWQRTHRDDLRMTCLDVGHGQAILAQLPGTRNVLFDAGSLYKRDVGTRIVAPFLDYMGITRLDAVVISHGDVDHINGIPEIAGHCPIGHFYATRAFLSSAQDERAPRLLVQSLSEKSHTIEPFPDHLDSGPATIRVLWPTPDIPATTALRDNDLSAVSLIQFNGVSVLLCSDIESFAQRQVLTLYPQLQAQIVTAPHHGSTTTASEGFLPHFSPSIVLCSCGRRDHRAVQNQPHTAIPQWFHTSINGATSIRVDANGIVSTWSCLN
jgi:competence protein ComEC